MHTPNDTVMPTLPLAASNTWMSMAMRRSWGQALALLDRSRKLGWVDLLVVVGLVGVLYGVLELGTQWTHEFHETVEIDLSPKALPLYTFFSLCRGLIAYVISLLFTLVYGYWAAKDALAERVLVPLLDILQSIPVLGFLPALVLAFVALFPTNNIGLELACVIMIFTGQAWNMTFSFYRSVKSVPLDQREVATVYRFSWWQRFKWVELPSSMIGLVWNSMMSMAGGWFFLSACEAFQLGDKDFRLPGIGSYVSVAVHQKRYDAMFYAFAAMMIMIIAVDQLLWRPITVWATKFRVEEGGDQSVPTSWFLNWLTRSSLVALVVGVLKIFGPRYHSHAPMKTTQKFDPTVANPWIDRLVALAFGLLLIALGVGAWKLFTLLTKVTREQWGGIGVATVGTLLRVLAATALGTLWALPAGLAIGLSPRLSRIMQPVVQVVASFPPPMLFPIVIAILAMGGVGLGWGSIVLMLLGTQWYILFNVIAGASAIPADLKEMTTSYRIAGWQRFRDLYFPGVFPYLVTGWVTAAGGAWNASILSEWYTTSNDEILRTWGLGAEISSAVYHNNIPMLAASVLVMSTVVVLFNRTVWRRCYRLAEERYSLNK
jgi:NitT/TauT family transport system permease protein